MKLSTYCTRCLTGPALDLQIPSELFFQCLVCFDSDQLMVVGGGGGGGYGGGEGGGRRKGE
jgi:hypothetical protein